MVNAQFRQFFKWSTKTSKVYKVVYEKKKFVNLGSRVLLKVEIQNTLQNPKTCLSGQ